MSETPDRVWVQKDASEKGPLTAFYHVGSWPGERTEYVHADRIKELEAENARLRRAIEGLLAILPDDEGPEIDNARTTLAELNGKDDE